VFGGGYHQAGFLEDLSAYCLLGGFAWFQAAAGQSPPLAAAGSSTSLVHHQHTAIAHDHGGGPFSFIHDPQANRRTAIVLKTVDNLVSYRAVTGRRLTDLDDW